MQHTVLKNAFSRSQSPCSFCVNEKLSSIKQRFTFVVMLTFQYRVGDASNERNLCVGIGAKSGAIQMTMHLIHMPTGSYSLRNSKSHY